MRRSHEAVVLSLVLGLAGCASNDAALPPAPTPSPALEPVIRSSSDGFSISVPANASVIVPVGGTARPSSGLDGGGVFSYALALDESSSDAFLVVQLREVTNDRAVRVQTYTTDASGLAQATSVPVSHAGEVSLLWIFVSTSGAGRNVTIHSDDGPLRPGDASIYFEPSLSIYGDPIGLLAPVNRQVEVTDERSSPASGVAVGKLALRTASSSPVPGVWYACVSYVAAGGGTWQADRRNGGEPTHAEGTALATQAVHPTWSALTPGTPELAFAIDTASHDAGRPRVVLLSFVIPTGTDRWPFPPFADDSTKPGHGCE